MRILIINGPNLNLINFRSKGLYGTLNLKEINHLIKTTYPELIFTFKQHNSEEKIIKEIHKEIIRSKHQALIINAAAFTHTSIAIRDALEMLKIPKISVHLSNILEREDFRKTDYIHDVVHQNIMGEKEKSYFIAIDAIKRTLRKEEKNDNNK